MGIAKYIDFNYKKYNTVFNSCYCYISNTYITFNG